MKFNNFSFLLHPNCGWHNSYFYYLYYSKIMLHLRKCGVGKMLDLGAGDGHYEELLTHFGFSYESVDWSASPHAGEPDIVGDLNKRLAIPNDYCEVLFCWSVLEHLSEPKFFLHECSRILKPDGKLILQVPFMWQVHESPHDFFRFTEHGLNHLLTGAGFRVLDMSTQGGILVTLTMKVFYQLNRFVPNKFKKIFNVLLFPIGILGYTVAHLLDCFSKSDGETSGYILLAEKM